MKLEAMPPLSAYHMEENHGVRRHSARGNVVQRHSKSKPVGTKNGHKVRNKRPERKSATTLGNDEKRAKPRKSILKKSSKLVASKFKKQKNLSFGTVEVREYARCLGNHPPVEPDGPSLSIDWMFVSKEKTPVAKFEKKRSSERDECFEPMDGEDRIALLLDQGYCTMEEIQENMRECDQLRRQRENSMALEAMDGFFFLLERFQGAMASPFKRKKKLSADKKTKERLNYIPLPDLSGDAASLEKNSNHSIPATDPTSIQESSLSSSPEGQPSSRRGASRPSRSSTIHRPNETVILTSPAITEQNRKRVESGPQTPPRKPIGNSSSMSTPQFKGRKSISASPSPRTPKRRSGHLTSPSPKTQTRKEARPIPLSPRRSIKKVGNDALFSPNDSKGVKSGSQVKRSSESHKTSLPISLKGIDLPFGKEKELQDKEEKGASDRPSSARKDEHPVKRNSVRKSTARSTEASSVYRKSQEQPPRSSISLRKSFTSEKAKDGNQGLSPRSFKDRDGLSRSEHATTRKSRIDDIPKSSKVPKRPSSDRQKQSTKFDQRKPLNLSSRRSAR